MAQSLAFRSPQNSSLSSNNKLASAAPTESNNIFTMSSAPTPTFAIAPATTSSSMARYLEDELQRILRTVLDIKSPAFLSVSAPALHYKDFCQKPLKAQFQTRIMIKPT